MGKWKSVQDEKTGQLKNVPVNAAAKREYLAGNPEISKEEKDKLLREIQAEEKADLEAQVKAAQAEVAKRITGK